MSDKDASDRDDPADESGNGGEKRSRGADRLKQRFNSGSGSGEESSASGTSDTSGMSGTSKTEDTSSTGTSVGGLKAEEDRKNLNMYLPESLIQELNAKYAEVNATAVADHGHELEKNRDYYPALIRAAFDDSRDVEDVLFE